MELITTVDGVLNGPTPLPLKATFAYDEADPMTVKMRLTVSIDLPNGSVATDSTVWEFARDLLDESFSKPDTLVGQGDVKLRMQTDPECPVLAGIMLGDPQLRVDLYDVDNKAHPIYLAGGPLVQFMADSLRLVPAHTEHVDVDDAISHILRGTA